MNNLIAVCLGGCENEVRVDILSKLIPVDKNANVEILPGSAMEYNRMSTRGYCGGSCGEDVFKGEAGCGKLMVSTTADCHSLLSSIRSVQYWMVYLTHSVDTKGSLKVLSAFTALLNESSIDWPHSYATWRSCLKYYESSCASSPSDTDRRDRYQALSSDVTQLPRFCARCIRDGEHSYNSVDVARAVGDWTAEATGWAVDLTKMDLEVVCFLMNETFVVGLSIPSENSFFTRSRLPTESRAPVVSADDVDNKVRTLGVHNSLRPSTAHMLLHLCKPLAGDIVVDALCGTGACMIEAAYSFNCIALGGDADPCSQAALQKGMHLAGSMSKNTAVTEALLWGANYLPLRNNSIDIVIVDLPFGKPSSVLPKRFRAKMSKFVAQTLRVLREGSGRCVFLTQSHQQLSVCLDSVYVSTKHVRLVNFGGYVSTLMYAERSSVPFREEVVVHQVDGTVEAGGLQYNMFTMPVVRSSIESSTGTTTTAAAAAAALSTTYTTTAASSSTENLAVTADDTIAAAQNIINSQEHKKRKIEDLSESSQLGRQP